jgi:hypothetical protein
MDVLVSSSLSLTFLLAVFSHGLSLHVRISGVSLCALISFSYKEPDRSGLTLTASFYLNYLL